MALDVSVSQQGKRVVLQVMGTIDEKGAEALRQHFSDLPLDQLEEVVLDMAGVPQIGSSGIGKILLFYKNLGLGGGRLMVTNLAPHLYELFCELKLDTLFTVSGRGG